MRIMKIRPYREQEDYQYLSRWVDSERVHAFWCANLLPYPITREDFHAFLDGNAAKWGDQAYVAVDERDVPEGFFCSSFNPENKEGFFKFIIVDPDRRGMGCGPQMLELALQKIFRETDALLVQLNVFAENPAARRCYEKAGFVRRRFEENVFPYKNELWSKYNMVAQRKEE